MQTHSIRVVQWNTMAMRWHFEWDASWNVCDCWASSSSEIFDMPMKKIDGSMKMNDFKYVCQKWTRQVTVKCTEKWQRNMNNSMKCFLRCLVWKYSSIFFIVVTLHPYNIPRLYVWRHFRLTFSLINNQFDEKFNWICRFYAIYDIASAIQLDGMGVNTTRGIIWRSLHIFSFLHILHGWKWGLRRLSHQNLMFTVSGKIEHFYFIIFTEQLTSNHYVPFYIQDFFTQ